METEQKLYRWSEGLPTKPEVDAMLKAFPFESLIPGVQIEDSQITEIIGDRGYRRFVTVTNVWRRRLQRDHSVTVYRAAERGFFVPTPAQILARGNPRMTHIVRTTGAHLRDLGTAKAENDIQKAEIEHQGMKFHVFKREAKKVRMALLPPTTASQLPRIEPPKSASDSVA